MMPMGARSASRDLNPLILRVMRFGLALPTQ
jgi:hypothetical protein